MIRPTSKIALKQSCLMACKEDLEEAQKLYDFYVKDLESLPDFDIPPKTTIEQVRETAGGMFDWIKQNQDMILSGIDMIRTLRGGGGLPAPSAPANVPPIPKP